MYNVRNKPFKCNICDAVFKSKTNLNGHTNSVHERNRPFKCNVCVKNFSRKFTLNQHVASIHEEKKKTVESNNETRMEKSKYFETFMKEYSPL